MVRSSRRKKPRCRRVYRRRTGARVTGFTRDCDRALGLAPDHHDLGALAGEVDRCCTSFPRVAPVITTSVTAATLLSADHDPCPTVIRLVNKAGAVITASNHC